MHVSELIDLVSQLSFGRVQPTEKERNLYLRFLNLANLEMWQLAVNASQFLRTQDLFFEDGENTVDIPDGYYLKGVFLGNHPLTKCNFDNILDVPQSKYSTINNVITITANHNQSTKLDPSDNKYKRYITVVLLENAKVLVENVTDSTKEVDTPVYPMPYHLGLVHGALFYLYTSNKGFTEKIKYQMLAWSDAKKNLANYYS